MILYEIYSRCSVVGWANYTELVVIGLTIEGVEN